MTEEIKAISVGLRVNLSQLDADLQRARLSAQNIAAKQYKINFSVGKIDLAPVEFQIKTLLAKKITVTPTVTATRATARGFRDALQTEILRHGALGVTVKLARGGTKALQTEILATAIPVKITLASGAAAAIRKEVEAALAGITVGVSGGGAGRGGARGGAGATSSTVTPHERRVNDDLATKVGRATRETVVRTATPTPAVTKPSAAAKAAVVAPVPPVKASAPAGATVAPPAAQKAPPVVSAAPAAQRPAPSRATAQSKARPAPARAPAAEPEPLFDWGAPSGPASGLVTRRQVPPDPSALSLADTAAPGTRSAGRYLRKKAERSGGTRLGPNELAQARAQQPETPEEIEYASRPDRVSLPVDAQGEFEQEKRGSGVRGAGRSGLMKPGERRLTEDERLNLDMIHDRESHARSAERDEELRAPSRANVRYDKDGKAIATPYYGSPSSNPRMRQHMSGVQMYKMHPALGEAFEHLSAGRHDEARTALRGFSGKQLASPDPRKRKKFFKLFKNAENVPPEMLERHAALGALFAQISIEESQGQLDKAQAAVKAFPKPKGSQENWPTDVVDEWQALLATQRTAQQVVTESLQGVRPAAQGRGPKPAAPKRAGKGEAQQKSIDSARLAKGDMSYEDYYRRHPNERPVEAVPDIPVKPGGYPEPPPVWKRPKGRMAGGRVESTPYLRVKGRVADWRAQNPEPSMSSPKYRDWFNRFQTAQTSFYDEEKDEGAPGWRERKAGWAAHEANGTGSFSDHRGGWSAPGQVEAPAPQSQIDKLRAMATQKTQSPNEASVAASMLRKRGIPGYITGGRVGGSLSERIAQQQAMAQGEVYRVGETKPETFIGDSGHTEIIGEKGEEIRAFPEGGQILPYVPEWVRRQAKNAKDFTRRATGGGVYAGRLAAEPDSGLRGRKVFREGFEGERAAIGAGQLSATGGVQRVFVVNMGSGFGGITSAGRGGSVAAGPYSGGADPVAAINKKLEDLLKSSKPIGTVEQPEAEGPSYKLTPEQKVNARIESIFGATAKELRDIHTQMQTEAKEAVSNAPVRGAGPALGQITAGVLGRQELLRRTGIAQAALAQSARARGILSGEVKAEQEKQTQLDEATTPQQREKAAEALDKQRVATGRAADEVKRLDLEAGKAVKSANALSLRAGVFAGNMVGLAGGVVLFSAVLGVAQKGLEYLTPSIDRVIDKMGGYQIKANEVTKELGAQVRATNGLVDITLAQREASIGLGIETGKLINPLLGQRAQIEAGNNALTDQIDLIHAYQGALKQQGGARFPIGLTETTGGLNILGSQTGLGGTRSTFEQINAGLDIGKNGPGHGLLPQFDKGLNTALYEGLPGFDSGTGFAEKGNPLAEAAYGTKEKADAAAADNRKRGGSSPFATLTGLDKNGGFDFGKFLGITASEPGDRNLIELGGNSNPDAPAGLAFGQGPAVVGTPSGALPPQVKLTATQQSGVDVFVTDLNENIKRAGGSMKLLTASTDDQRVAQNKQVVALRESGIPRLVEFADRLAQNNLLLEGVSSDPAQLIKDVLKGGEDIAKGASTPDLDQLLAAQKNQFAAQRAQIRAEGNLQRQLIPGRVALGQIAQPTAGLTGGPAFGAGTVGVDPSTGKTDTAAKAAAGKYQTLVGGAIKDVNALIAQGRQDMMDLVPPDLRSDFANVLGEVEKTGAAIAGIQTDLAQEQANVAVMGYNNQLRIAKRSLQDAKDLVAGIKGDTRDTVGGLEGQNIVLQRQLQLLGFAMAQRQINFKLATAGFVAPGTTPEERAARIEMAKKEAEFAQKQLDIQKQLGSNQYRGTTMEGGTASRQVTDLAMQIDQLQRERTLTINSAAAAKALDILNKKQNALLEKAQTYIEEGTKVVTALSTATTQIMAQTGKGFNEVLSQTAAAWGVFGAQAKIVLQTLLGTAPKTGTSQYLGSTKVQNLGEQASGIMFDTSGPANLTVGEAGKETVAVLRNPRQMSLPQLMGQTREFMPTSAASGGGIHITVILTGNSISKDTDLHALAEEIAEAAARKAEDRLMRKASLLSGRRV